MEALTGFNPAQHEPTWGGAGGFFPVSDDKGWLCVITGDDGWKDMSTGNGKYLAILLKGIEGTVNGMDATLRLNLQHTEVGTRQGALGQLSALCRVTNTPHPGNRDLTIGDLVNKPFRIVSVKQGNDDKGYTQLAREGIRDVNGNKPGAGPTAVATAAQAMPTTPAPAPAPVAPPANGWAGTTTAPAVAPTPAPTGPSAGWGQAPA